MISRSPLFITFVFFWILDLNEYRPYNLLKKKKKKKKKGKKR